MNIRSIMTISAEGLTLWGEREDRQVKKGGGRGDPSSQDGPEPTGIGHQPPSLPPKEQEASPCPEGAGGQGGVPGEQVTAAYPGLLQEQEAVFIQHGLGAFQQLRGDCLKLLVHCRGKR